jgi:PIN domain nuclease of toxin-antitoxin system
MRYLLDTNAFLWFITNDPKMSKVAARIIPDPANEVFVSIVTPWEIAIKVGIGKLTLNEPIAVAIPREINQNNLNLLSITLDQTFLVATLPHHHRDPFDRLLIAQAMAEGMPILSADAGFDAYGITRIW